ncbi:inactive C-alpha-formylglycine-generating enzyme 2-like [Dreissena polymorpha]|uniref:inactive C-alpha-formylglycine-generating enzyme 2-like n=1 Tax=Dreissena polymorpha TaxID=45954 RepID=UPI002263CED9|nr:inactive C-alpha-formylglycine-generating enzyme 2-like [Dreissena polymorpha]
MRLVIVLLPIIKMSFVFRFKIIQLFLFITSSFNCSFSLSSDDVDKLLQQHYDFKDSMRQQFGGRFTIGINDPQSDTGEYPVRQAEVRPFYMDTYPVTVAQFWKYKMAKKKYRTSAETNGYSWVLARLVSDLIRRRWSSESADPWWLAVKGAQWDRPEGPGTHARTRLDYPVVHVSYHDARAYCQWSGKRLPTEEEWEYAARAQLPGLQYPWGDKYKKNRMNVWQGKFPDDDTALDGWAGLSPVDAFPSQNNNSMYDMLGNAWEWTSTRYYERVVDRKLQELKYVLKGGSYMDTKDGSANYVVRTANRMGQVPAYSAHNVGFRCAASAPHLVQRQRMTEQAKETPTTTRRPPKIHRLEEMAFPPPRSNRKKEEL